MSSDKEKKYPLPDGLDEEVVSLFNALPDDDPYKEAYYKNIWSIDVFLNEEREERP